jgi:DNA-directed RNA polymerase specialized sigma24 family protein
MTQYRGQTGGDRKHWLFDPARAEGIAPIMEKLVHEDVYFGGEDDLETVLIKVLDRLLDELPEDQRLAVRAVYLTGMTLRAAARSLGVDHKTVKLRAEKGVEAMRQRLTDTAWIADMLSGAVPADEVPTRKLSSSDGMLGVLRRLNDGDTL